MSPEPDSADRMYRRLDVPPEASAQQIGRAYRRLAHSLHPDAHPDDPDASLRFQEITEAYETLSDPTRRARYDRHRQPPPPSDRRPPRPAANTHTIAVTPIHAPGQGGSHPVFIGLGPFRTPSAPLTAGPVHVASPSTAPGPTSSTDLAQLIDTILRAWRRW